jgi:hypothetical protein
MGKSAKVKVKRIVLEVTKNLITVIVNHQPVGSVVFTHEGT